MGLSIIDSNISNDGIEVKNVNVTNLTKMYGSGKEPNITDYEKNYGKKSWNYEEGKLISIVGGM